MKFIVYKVVHGDHARWYARRLQDGEFAPYPLIFVGENAEALACQKARHLNERCGRLALAA